VWIFAQIMLYYETGDLSGENHHLCHLREDQATFAVIFLWSPIICNLIGSAIFIRWLNTRNVMLSRKRVNVFAWILFVSCLLKSVSVITDIQTLENWGQSNKTAVAAEEAATGYSPDTLVFLGIIFYDFHLVLMVIGFAEKLFPLLLWKKYEPQSSKLFWRFSWWK
jgi:hypothetical protein